MWRCAYVGSTEDGTLVRVHNLLTACRSFSPVIHVFETQTNDQAQVALDVRLADCPALNPITSQYIS